MIRVKILSLNHIYGFGSHTADTTVIPTCLRTHRLHQLSVLAQLIYNMYFTYYIYDYYSGRHVAKVETGGS